jgi:hypothetical protein
LTHTNIAETRFDTVKTTQHRQTSPGILFREGEVPAEPPRICARVASETWSNELALGFLR